MSLSAIKKISIFLIFLLNLTFTSNAQITDKSHKYVVTGVYLTVADAEKHLSDLKTQDIDGKYLKHNYPDKRTLYYCYTYVSKDLKASLQESENMRTKSGFEETWVFVVVQENAEKSIVASERKEPTNEPESPVIIDTSEIKEEITGIESGADTIPDEEPEIENIDETVESVKYFKIFTNTLDVKNLEPVPSTIKVVDGNKSSLIAILESNQLDSIKERTNGEHKVQIATEAPGYKRIVYDIDLDNPIDEITKNYAQLNEGVIELDLPLQPLKSGDYQILYNIYFYNDASVMKPQSKFELESLFKLLNNKASMKIRIHGHTNGKAFGKIIKLDEEDENWFVLSPNNKRSTGTAAELSKQRSLTIKRYLVSQGISEDRLEIKGWGGKKMIHDEEHPLAHQNVRVEIEVIEE